MRVDPSHDALVQTHGVRDTARDLDVNRGLGEIAYPHKFISLNKGTLWCRMLVIGEALHEGGGLCLERDPSALGIGSGREKNVI